MAKIFHADLHGLSRVKDKTLLTLDIAKTKWSNIDIEASSSYLLIPQSYDLRKEYDRGWKITDVMKVNSVAIVTGQDSKTISIKKEDAQLLALGHKLSTIKVEPILYRPFDIRHIVYDSTVVTRPRSEVMRHMLAGANLGLIARRSMIGDLISYFSASQYIISDGVIRSDNKGSESLFPLYLYPTTPAEIEMGITRKPNISPEFLVKLEQNLGYTPTPEAIFYYIYAIFHSPSYRSRYAEFLKMDFPRVPITSEDKLFHLLSELGEKLVNLHLMKSPALAQTSSPFMENGGGCIVDAGHPKYENGKVIINKKQDCFVNVPEEIWNFHVGGYQVCQKWLKDRKGRTLSPDDISHYQKIVVALGQTIELMTKIDEAIPEWPIQ